MGTIYRGRTTGKETAMDVIGTLNAAQGPGAFGFEELKRVHANLDAPLLVEEALKRGEARLAHGGALVADTGIHTGRSPKDKFIVKDEGTEGEIWWANNGAITPAQFAALRADFIAHARGRELFVQDLYGGADATHRV